MGDPASIWLLILALAIATGIGFLVSVLLELRRSAQRLTSILAIVERSLDPLLRDLGATARQLNRATGEFGVVTDDVRVFSGSLRRAGKSVDELSGLVSVASFGSGAGLAAWQIGIGTGLTYLAKHLFRKRGSS